MFSWDIAITTLVVAGAAAYVIQSIYKAISGAGHGCSGCCSACSRCAIGGNDSESIGDKMAQAIALAKQHKNHR